MTLHPLENAGEAKSFLRWTAAGLVVLAAHAGLGTWVLTHSISKAEAPDTAQGIMIDLEPIATSENALQPNEAVAHGAARAPQIAATPDPRVEPQPETPPEPQRIEPQPEPTPSPVSRPEPAPLEELKPVPLPTPEPAQALRPPIEGKSDAVFAPPPPLLRIETPQPKPVPQKPRPPRPDPKRLARGAAERKALTEPRAQGQAARAAAQARDHADEAREAGAPANEAAAPSSVSSGAAVATWRGAVKAHLDGYRRESPNGASGMARIVFSVDRSGRILSASVAASSGDGTLDQAALALVRQASPVPAPPPELGDRVSLVAPVRFR